MKYTAYAMLCDGPIQVRISVRNSTVPEGVTKEDN
jgi:hypothetical protein